MCKEVKSASFSALVLTTNCKIRKCGFSAHPSRYLWRYQHRQKMAIFLAQPPDILAQGPIGNDLFSFGVKISSLSALIELGFPMSSERLIMMSPRENIV